MSEKTPWNHNIHYESVLLGAVPPGASRGLDIGCGEGHLTRRLARRVAHVVGIDLDPPSIERARRATCQENVDYILGDVRSHPFAPESFDVIVSVATLHHLAAAPALKRFAELLQPGGVLGIIGLARARLPRDFGWEVAGSLTTQVLKRTGGGPTGSTPRRPCGRLRSPSTRCAGSAKRSCRGVPSAGMCCGGTP